jgi:IS5 family transposase
MIGKSPNQNQRNLFRPILKEFINPEHPLVVLSGKIPWKQLEKDFSDLYSNTGQPAKPIRLMVGILLLKRMYNLGDETIMDRWIQDPYFQYFCGESEFQWDYPCDPSDLVHFRNRIGTEGVEKLFQLSVEIQKDKFTRKRDLVVDTTAQEKNVTYPTDAKLYRKIVEKCNKIAKKEGIQLRQSYTRVIKQLLIDQRFAHHPKKRKKATKSKKKMKTIAGRITRDIERKLPQTILPKYQDEIDLFKRVIVQVKSDKNKVYSLHEPFVACLAKGKAHKKFEFGSKVSFAMLPGSNLIVGVKNFNGNPHDSTTLEDTLNHVKKITGKIFSNAIVDRGYRGKKAIGETKIILPNSPKGKTPYQKRKMRKKCRSRAAIEPVIGHIKTDCRMARNYLKGTVGDEMNAILAATGFNLRLLLKEIERNIILAIFKIINISNRKSGTYFRFQILSS